TWTLTGQLYAAGINSTGTPAVIFQSQTAPAQPTYLVGASPVNPCASTSDTYFQVFFDRVYGIPFEHILRLISTPENKGKRFKVERNTKNQFKNTIHMNVKEGVEVAYKVTMPQHRSEMKRLPKGRLLFHVTFEGGEAYLNLGTLYNLLQIPYESE
ncbi:MAG: AccI family restriction endonuclease, partial [Pyrinomonadaceae bacterium]